MAGFYQPATSLSFSTQVLQVLVTGKFTSLGIAKVSGYNVTSQQSLTYGNGFNDDTYCGCWDPVNVGQFYVGGKFWRSAYGEIVGNYVKRWNGTNFMPLASSNGVTSVTGVTDGLNQPLLDIF